MFKPTFKIVICVLFLIFASCEDESLDNVILSEEALFESPEDSEPETSCSDRDIVSFLFECIWAPSSERLDIQLFIDFSSLNIVAYEQNDLTLGELADEGSWSIQDGVVTFDNLRLALSEFNGDWTVIECREGFIELQRRDDIISFERVCLE